MNLPLMLLQLLESPHPKFWATKSLGVATGVGQGIGSGVKLVGMIPKKTFLLGPSKSLRGFQEDFCFHSKGNICLQLRMLGLCDK